MVSLSSRRGYHQRSGEYEHSCSTASGLIYSSGTVWISQALTKGVVNSLSMLPALMSSEISFGDLPSTWQPTLKAVPRISSTVPFSSRAADFLASRIVRAMSMISSRGMDLECLMFFSFFRSRGGSLRARMTRDEAEGTTETAACRFWMVSLTVTRRPFCEGRQIKFSCGVS
jgi:hypothetical protein